MSEHRQKKKGDILYFDLLENPNTEEYRAKFLEKYGAECFPHNPEFGLQAGDKIIFKNGYDLVMMTEILGFDTDGDAFLLWDCWWATIKLKDRFIQKF